MKTGNAGRALDATCDEFLARYSEYMDGRLSPAMAARLGSHAAACASCARYDRIVRKGAALVRELPDIEPSETFELRLQHRIFHVQDAAALAAPRATGAAAVLGIAAAIALLAWSPLLVARPEGSTPVAAAAAEAVAPEEPLPLFQESGWYPVLPAQAETQRSTLLASFPGPYSPLFVAPPVHRSVRSVSSEYAPID